MKKKNVIVTAPAVWSVMNANPEAAKCARKTFKEKSIFWFSVRWWWKKVSEIELLKSNDSTGQGSAGFTVPVIDY